MQKPREQIVNGKQKNRFAGATKKNKASKIAQRSLVPVHDRTELTDSDDDNQPEFGNIAIVVKPPKKHLTPRTMYAM